jgi:hypothetical protein
VIGAEVNFIFAHECKPFPVHVVYSRQLLLTADRRTNRNGKTQACEKKKYMVTVSMDQDGSGEVGDEDSLVEQRDDHGT